MFLCVQVFDLASLSPTATPQSTSHLTLHNSDQVSTFCWVEPRCLATASRNSNDISIWNVGSHIDTLRQGRRAAYDQRNIYNPTRTISNEAPALCMGVANDLLITGDGEGCVRVLDPKSGQQLQAFRDHKGRITDLSVDSFRVLSCSVDFSIRVYRWLGEARPGKAAKLESRYTLLGGSLALKQQ